MSFAAFHNDKKVKKFYLDRVIKHRKQDEVIKGRYWENGKGCAVGCTIHGSNHKDYEKELGIPEWLARVEDTLFEGMSDKKAKAWPERFLKAIRPGADLSKAETPFVLVILKSLGKQYDAKKYPDVKAAIKTCVDLYKKGDLTPSPAWDAAYSAAHSAAYSAGYAASYAANAANAAANAAWSAANAAAWSASSAANAAYSASSAAYSAAWSAAYSASSAANAAQSAGYAAQSAGYEKFADALIKILKEL